MSRTRIASTVAAVAVAAVGGALALAAPATAATVSPAAAACDRAPWQPIVQGAPRSFDAGDSGGDYLWHDTSGFHLRVTHRGDGRQVYSGTISSSSPMRIDPVRLEGHDTVRLSADHKTLAFAFADYGHIDGVDVHTDCASTLVVSHLHVGTAELPAGRVYLGALERHPAAVPFVLHRA
ncbi:MAG TPA: hypothetical protein VMB79_05845 [Jatrophihabitans sp.]|nr:hypothetical protein [Jatrophihabitans sp.]